LDWKKTKNIFILTFLVLNLFLGYQLYQKNDINNISMLSQQPLEEILEINGIDYKDKIPKYKPEQTLISAQRYSFTEEESSLKSKDIIMDKEKSTAITLYYSLKQPLDLPKKDSNDLVETLSKFLEDNVSRGTEYSFFQWDKKENIIWFNQIYLNKSIFYDPGNFENPENSKDTKDSKDPKYSKWDFSGPNGMIKFYLDDKGRLTKFTQTYLNIMRQGASQEILSPEKALGRLLDTGHLKDDKVKDIKLGYYSLVGVGDLQVYAPTWFIETEDDGQYLVNATDSSIQVLSGEEE
jgi:regulatory protein YycI of two-component signal transduction system YycFG